MSYDLYLKPENEEFSEENFKKYFSSRDKYNLEGSQAWYENEDTGVYFLFEFQCKSDLEDGEEYYPVLFNINYFRPFYFINEAEPELSKFVSFFSMVVNDYQTNGMKQGKYDSKKLYSGWKYGNEFAYKSMLKEDSEIYALPTQKLNYIWEWNFKKNAVQEEVTDDLFVPSIMFLTYKGSVVSASVWPDAIPSLIPMVDIFIIGRTELAPKKFFKKSEDMAIGLFSEFLPLIEKYKQKMMNGGYYLYYDSVPNEISKKVRSLSPTDNEIERLDFDLVLDEEIIYKYKNA